MQSFEVSGAVRPIYGSLGVKRLIMRDSHLPTNAPNSVTNYKLA